MNKNHLQKRTHYIIIYHQYKSIIFLISINFNNKDIFYKCHTLKKLEISVS